MKIIAAILSIVSSCFSVSGAASPAPLVVDQVRRADAIAIISTTAVKTMSSTNAAGRKITILFRDGTVERVLKGTLPKTIQVREEVNAAVISGIEFPRPRFLVFLRRSGEGYTLADAYDLVRIFGSGLGTDRVIWPDPV